MEPSEVLEKFLNIENWAYRDDMPVQKILEALAKYELEDLKQLGPVRQDALVQELIDCFETP